MMGIELLNRQNDKLILLGTDNNQKFLLLFMITESRERSP